MSAPFPQSGRGASWRCSTTWGDPAAPRNAPTLSRDARRVTSCPINVQRRASLRTESYEAHAAQLQRNEGRIEENIMAKLVQKLIRDEKAQDLAEYGIALAVIGLGA